MFVGLATREAVQRRQPLAPEQPREPKPVPSPNSRATTCAEPIEPSERRIASTMARGTSGNWGRSARMTESDWASIGTGMLGVAQSCGAHAPPATEPPDALKLF